MQDAERQFAAENPVQISPDSQNRDCKQHETDPDADADHTVQQADAGFSKTVEYAGESGVQVQKRTDIGHGMDIDSGCLTVKQKISRNSPRNRKKPSRIRLVADSIGKSCRSHIGFAFDTPESAAG